MSASTKDAFEMDPRHMLREWFASGGTEMLALDFLGGCFAHKKKELEMLAMHFKSTPLTMLVAIVSNIIAVCHASNVNWRGRSIPLTMSVLNVGPPGCGKSIAFIVAKLVYAYFNDLKNDYLQLFKLPVHDSRNVPEEVRKNQPKTKQKGETFTNDVTFLKEMQQSDKINFGCDYFDDALSIPYFLRHGFGNMTSLDMSYKPADFLENTVNKGRDEVLGEINGSSIPALVMKICSHGGAGIVRCTDFGLLWLKIASNPANLGYFLNFADSCIPGDTWKNNTCNIPTLTNVRLSFMGGSTLRTYGQFVRHTNHLGTSRRFFTYYAPYWRQDSLRNFGKRSRKKKSPPENNTNSNSNSNSNQDKQEMSDSGSEYEPTHDKDHRWTKPALTHAHLDVFLNQNPEWDFREKVDIILKKRAAQKAAEKEREERRRANGVNPRPRPLSNQNNNFADNQLNVSNENDSDHVSNENDSDHVSNENDSDHASSEENKQIIEFERSCDEEDEPMQIETEPFSHEEDEEEEEECNKKKATSHLTVDERMDILLRCDPKNVSKTLKRLIPEAEIRAKEDVKLVKETIIQELAFDLFKMWLFMFIIWDEQIGAPRLREPFEVPIWNMEENTDLDLYMKMYKDGFQVPTNQIRYEEPYGDGGFVPFEHMMRVEDHILKNEREQAQLAITAQTALQHNGFEEIVRVMPWFFSLSMVTALDDSRRSGRPLDDYFCLLDTELYTGCLKLVRHFDHFNELVVLATTEIKSDKQKKVKARFNRKTQASHPGSRPGTALDNSFVNTNVSNNANACSTPGTANTSVANINDSINDNDEYDGDSESVDLDMFDNGYQQLFSIILSRLANLKDCQSNSARSIKFALLRKKVNKKMGGNISETLAECLELLAKVGLVQLKHKKKNAVIKIDNIIKSNLSTLCQSNPQKVEDLRTVFMYARLPSYHVWIERLGTQETRDLAALCLQGWQPIDCVSHDITRKFDNLKNSLSSGDTNVGASTNVATNSTMSAAIGVTDDNSAAALSGASTNVATNSTLSGASTNVATNSTLSGASTNVATNPDDSALSPGMMQIINCQRLNSALSAASTTNNPNVRLVSTNPAFSDGYSNNSAFSDGYINNGNNGHALTQCNMDSAMSDSNINISALTDVTNTKRSREEYRGGWQPVIGLQPVIGTKNMYSPKRILSRNRKNKRRRRADRF